MHGPVHETFVIETDIEVGPAEVFAAYADVHVRVEWAAPGSDVIVYDKADFTVGSGDAFHCGPKDDPRFHGRVWYHEIVPDERLVYVESVRDGDQMLSVAMVTLELLPSRDGTRLRSTTQMISFVGLQMVADSKSGTRGLEQPGGMVLSRRLSAMKSVFGRVHGVRPRSDPMDPG